MSFFRSDLAAEIYSLSRNSAMKSSCPSGLSVRDELLFGLSVNCLEISDLQTSQMLGKPMGSYFTLELPRSAYRSSESFPSVVNAVAVLIRRCARDIPGETLIAALGNPDITPDAIGPLAAANILVTRHMKISGSPDFVPFRSVALCRTGVLGTTGVESAVQIKTLCQELGVGLVIAVDALACAEVSHLCRTVQISSCGIAPGSGVGNDRESLDRDFLGVPVVAVGVPTVIDASHFSDSEELMGMFVTPRSIDSLVRCAARIIGYGIDLALHDGLTIEDVDMLLG